MAMPLVLNEPAGSDITVLSVHQYNQWKHKGSGKDDVLFIVYKDGDHEKKIQAVKNPPMEIYYTKPEHRTFNTPREYIEIDKTYPRTVTARSILSDIANEMKDCPKAISTAQRRIYSQAMATGNRAAAKEILKWPYVHMADVDAENYYNIIMGTQYNRMRTHTVDRAFLDIESDVYGLSTSEMNANIDRTNACTVIFKFSEQRKGDNKTKVFTFLLRDHDKYPQQVDFENRLEEFNKLCHSTFDIQTVSKGGKDKDIDCAADYYIKIYNKESDLLSAIFETINEYKPDTCSVWNIAYDIPKLSARMQKNNLNYVDVMCDPRIPAGCRFVEMNIDDRPGVEIADRKTFIRMASTTVWIDQMQAYAGIRKGRKAYGSNTLDNIANIEMGVGKLQFAKGIDIRNAPILDYWNFVLYNITDVWRQVIIDDLTNDAIGMICDMNQANCPTENLTKQTKYQRQIYYAGYLAREYVPGCNANINYMKGETEEKLDYLNEVRATRRSLDEDYDSDIDEELSDELNSYADDYDDSVSQNWFKDSPERKLRLPGGLVGDPDNNIANGTELIVGVPSKHVHDDVMDMDYASEYPWIKYTRSVSRSSQIGRLIISNKISEKQNRLPMGQQKRPVDNNNYLAGAEFTSEYLAGDMLTFGNTWFNLPDTTTMSSIIDTELEGYMKLKRKGDK